MDIPNPLVWSAAGGTAVLVVVLDPRSDGVADIGGAVVVVAMVVSS